MQNLGDLLKDLKGSGVPNFSGPNANLGAVLSDLLTIPLLLAAFLAFYWLVWGAFQYILAKGDKEALAKARARISWALIGLMVVFMAYLIATYGSEIFPPTTGGLPF